MDGKRLARLSVVALLAALAVSGARAGDSDGPRSLRAIADAFSKEGDLEKAKTALERASATPGDLLAALRSPRSPEKEPRSGEYTLELEDGHGRKTELFVAAPTAEQIAKAPKEGLGLAVLLHGLGGDNGHMRALARAVAATGEVVAVAPSAKPLPEGEGGEDGVPAGGMFPHWWLYDSPRSFPLEAVKLARTLYAIDPERVLIAGHSMGGYGSFNIGLRRPDVFAGIGPLAGGLSRRAVLGGVEPESTRVLLENGRQLSVFSVHGTKDGLVPVGPDEKACKKLEEIGASVDFRKLDGVDHMLKQIWAGKGEVGADLVKFLTTKRRTSAPEHVTYVSVSERTDGAFWLRIATRKKPETGLAKARLDATVDRARNRIKLEGEGVSLARVYLDDRLLDLSKPVSVEAGGSVVFEGKVSPDSRAVLESWRSRRDEKLVYPAYVEVDPRTFH